MPELENKTAAVADPYITLEEIATTHSRAELEERFRHLAGLFEEEFLTAVQAVAKHWVARGERVSALYFVVDIAAGLFRFAEEEPGRMGDDTDFYVERPAQSAARFDALCEKLELRAAQEACAYCTAALGRLDSQGVFKAIMGDHISVDGIYDYHRDMEGVFFKRAAPPEVHSIQLSDTVPYTKGENPTLVRYVLEQTALLAQDAPPSLTECLAEYERFATHIILKAGSNLNITLARPDPAQRKKMYGYALSIVFAPDFSLLEVRQVHGQGKSERLLLEGELLAFLRALAQEVL